MMKSQVDRRSDVFQNSHGEKFDAGVVMEGMRLQAKVNTVTAIEYMKNRGVPATIIQRVLSGAAMREEDKEGIGAGA